MLAYLFVLGLVVGSFINVISLRYNPDKFLFSREVIGGRSNCPKCKNKLKWFELVPLLSFIFLRGQCRNCREKISFQYPLVEFASGLIFLLVSREILSARLINNLSVTQYSVLIMAYVLIFSILLLITLIDIRLKLIPNELNLLLLLLGVAIVIISEGSFGFTEGSFLGSYSAIFGFRGNIFLNHLFAAVLGLLFFGLLVVVTQGRGMGIGDVKLASVLGIIFGWPDIIIIFAISFVIGAILGLIGIVARRIKIKGLLPFGPFLAIGSIIVFLWGEKILAAYFDLFGFF